MTSSSDVMWVMRAGRAIEFPAVDETGALH